MASSAWKINEKGASVFFHPAFLLFFWTNQKRPCKSCVLSEDKHHNIDRIFNIRKGQVWLLCSLWYNLIFSHKMAGRAEDMCSSCFENTKYTCLRCINYFSMRCCVFENDESVAGWKAGSSVAYCESRFREKMILEETEGNDHEETGAGQKSQELSLNVQSTKPPAMKR